MPNSFSFRLQLLAICLLVFLFQPAAAGSVEINLTCDFARSGGNILAAVKYDIPAEYHAYSHRPGASGLPTSLEFTVENEGPMPVVYPDGIEAPDSFEPGLTVSTYQGRVTMLAVLPVSAGGKKFAASLDMLLCSSRHCLPYKQASSGIVSAEAPPLSAVSWEKDAVALLAGQGASDRSAGAAPLSGAVDRPEDNRNGWVESGLAESAPKAMSGEPGAWELESAFPPLQPRYANASLEIHTLGKALALGLLAGLLLNAMPCVLPVLTLKTAGLLLLGNLTDRQKLRQFREHNLYFAAGVLTFFTFLALLLGAADLMWGQLYQSQPVLLLMLLLVFLMGLSMLGVFTLPVVDLRIGASSRKPRLQSYLTGLVSTFLATPCSGPLLGGALAWALTQPLPVLLAVFWAIGLGMALPYITFSAWPNLARLLPRPGEWMYVFEHVLGFLLLGTALYLLSILPAEKRMQVLSVLLLVSMCAWLWGKFCGPDAPPIRRRLIGALGLILLAGAVFWVLRPVAPPLQWRPFSPVSFMADMGRKNMLLEFTADWCPNCKFLEASVFSASNLRAWQEKYDFELVQVDLTRPDPYAARLLEKLGSKSIPLTAIFPKGEAARNPVVLRDIYSAGVLEKCLGEAFGGL